MRLEIGDVTNDVRLEMAFRAALKERPVTVPVVERMPLHSYKNWLRRKLLERGFPEKLADNITFVFEGRDGSV